MRAIINTETIAKYSIILLRKGLPKGKSLTSICNNWIKYWETIRNVNTEKEINKEVIKLRSQYGTRRKIIILTHAVAYQLLETKRYKKSSLKLRFA